MADDGRLSRLLAYAALEPALRSILCFDFDPDELTATADALAGALKAIEERPVETVTLSSAVDDDSLWARIDWARTAAGGGLRMLSGPLAPHDADAPLPLVLIHDLTRMSLATARAVVMLCGADVAHLERHDQRARWRPRIAWVAACASGSVGELSPHLLDRFALRVPRPPGSDWSPSSLGELEAPALVLADPLAGVDIARARAARPARTHAALARALELGDDRAPGMRRALALARAAVAEARLHGRESTDPADVGEAARVLGMAAPLRRAPLTRATPPPAPDPHSHPERGTVAPSVAQEAGPARDGEGGSVEPVFAGDTTSALEAGELPTADARGAYPEDRAPVDREPETLRLPLPPRASRASAGVIVGVQPARDLRDLAIFATVLEAIKFQPARRAALERPRAGLILLQRDLRSHRRAPPTEALLALVLDCTARAGWDWMPSLMPFLRWAYASRAAACIVTVGARGAESEMRADRLLARNLLDPRAAGALGAAAGRATPLAHGLEVTLRTLRHALHHGSRGPLEARLVVVTDGRGNVPLEASLRDDLPVAVGRQGVQDALGVARQIAALDRVRATVVDPAPAVGADLPHALARALGATVVPGRADGA